VISAKCKAAAQTDRKCAFVVFTVRERGKKKRTSKRLWILLEKSTAQQPKSLLLFFFCLFAKRRAINLRKDTSTH